MRLFQYFSFFFILFFFTPGLLASQIVVQGSDLTDEEFTAKLQGQSLLYPIDRWWIENQQKSFAEPLMLDACLGEISQGSAGIFCAKFVSESQKLFWSEHLKEITINILQKIKSLRPLTFNESHYLKVLGCSMAGKDCQIKGGLQVSEILRQMKEKNPALTTILVNGRGAYSEESISPEAFQVIALSPMFRPMTFFGSFSEFQNQKWEPLAWSSACENNETPEAYLGLYHYSLFCREKILSTAKQDDLAMSLKHGTSSSNLSQKKMSGWWIPAITIASILFINSMKDKELVVSGF